MSSDSLQQQKKMLSPEYDFRTSSINISAFVAQFEEHVTVNILVHIRYGLHTMEMDKISAKFVYTLFALYTTIQVYEILNFTFTYYFGIW